MRNLMTFKLFEETSNHDYSLEDIKKLPGYLLLVAIGYYDTSTTVIKKHMNMRLYNDELGFTDSNDNVMIYSNGYVRKVGSSMQDWQGNALSGRPRVMKKFDGEDNLVRWNEQFLYLYDWTQKQYKKHGIDSKFNGIDKSDFMNAGSIMKYMIGTYQKNKAPVFSIYDSLSNQDKVKFLKGIKTTREEFEAAKKKYDDVMGALSSGLI